MFPAKYVAVNDFTEERIRKFRTKTGALTWYKKPMLFRKKDLGISIREIIQDQVGDK